MVQSIEFPSLQTAAGAKAAGYQGQYLGLIRLEYMLLVGASILSLDFSEEAIYFAAYALIFILAVAVMLVRSLARPEQNWYKARAAAESIKTSSWRYMMKAHPYEDAPSINVPNTRFREYLKSLTQTNSVFKEISGDALVQVTSSMQGVRCMSFEGRKMLYIESRISEQAHWYVNKAKSNRRSFRIWVISSCTLYGVAIALSIYHVAVPTLRHFPVEPIILGASFILGWLQIKKHSELAAAYTLTAVEIGLTKEAVSDVQGEQAFSDFVNDTELVFSREHTQWVARQQTSG